MEVNCQDDAYWRKYYERLCHNLGEIVDEQQDRIISLNKKNSRLKREIWNMKKTQRRMK